VLRSKTQEIGLIVLKNKAKKTWHRKLTVMWPDGSLETVRWQFRHKLDLEKI
jgi:hypothetical protein